jgi:histidyl-tRNA synthetase
MPLSTQPYKGARDFYPEDERLQKYLFAIMRRAVERFGYEEYEAPILEPLELYAAKSGEEIVNEQTYTFADRSGRQVAIRPEMTPSVSRLVAARRQELAYPLRWYSIPNLWRYERPQRGRMREHWQLNVDLFGVAEVAADLEIAQIAANIMKQFGASRDMYEIRLNHRALTDFVLQNYLGLDAVQAQSMGKLIDRKAKLEHADFVAQADSLFSPSQREAGASKHLLQLLEAKKLSDWPEPLQAQPAAKALAAMLAQLQDTGITNVRFDPTLMRGFDYYTGPVFEVFDTHPDNNRSLFGGGRYDGLVGLFGVDPVPTVGFGMGDVTLANFLELHELLPDARPETDLYVVLVGDVLASAQKVISELRENGLNVAVDITNRKVGQQIKTAEKKNIRFAMIVGEEELRDFSYQLKNLQTGEEAKHSVSRIASIASDYRQGNKTEL